MRFALLVVLLGCHAKDTSRVVPGRSIDAPLVDARPLDAAIDAAVPIDGGPIAEAPCQPTEVEGATAPPVRDVLTLTKTKFADLPEWKSDNLAGAVGSFLSSCEVVANKKDGDPMGVDGHGGVARQWRHACAAAKALTSPDDETAARAFFEAEFVPWIAAGKKGVDGKMTGYYVQEIRASRKKQGKFKYPVYSKPPDLVTINLTPFLADAHGRRIWARLDGKGELVPYYTRKEIRTGALAGKGLELMYVDDPTDLLFAQIEGSAKAKMDDGTVVWLEFSGKNGRSYKGVGGVLKEIGAFTKPGQGTMQGIHKWFDDNPTRFDEVVDQSASFVFFSESKKPGAIGSQGVVLTTQRSAAVDRSLIAHSTPLWIETNAPQVGKPGSAPWHHLLIAQDTGGGILGAVRADVYWGDDATAAELGGRMGGAGKYWLLLPKGVDK